MLRPSVTKCADRSSEICKEAAKTCVISNVCRYSYFKRVLKDMLNHKAGSSGEKLPEHSNIRGKDFYK
jgi:hypothetical protein